MTIEELRGANDFLSDAQIAIDNCEQEIDYEAVRTIRGLIDAEIARLSVTNVRLEIAATSLALMRDYVEKYMLDNYYLSKGAENIPLAIQALQAYRTEPCEWCEGKKFMQGTCTLNNGEYTLTTEYGDFNYCPNCGRKLTED